MLERQKSRGAKLEERARVQAQLEVASPSPVALLTLALAFAFAFARSPVEWRPCGAITATVLLCS
jgi:hypothetical protein